VVRAFGQQWGNGRSGLGNGFRRAGSLRALGGAGRVHGGGDLVEADFKQVPIRVERHGGRGVAEHRLHDLHVGTARDGEAGGGVAQFVRVQVGDADCSRRCAKGGAERRDAERLAVADAAEHEAIGLLACDQASEILDEEARDGHLAAPVRLRGTPDEALPWTGVTDSAMTARPRCRSSRFTFSAAISPNRTPV
jgi:hypothetical protein